MRLQDGWYTGDQYGNLVQVYEPRWWQAWRWFTFLFRTQHVTIFHADDEGLHWNRYRVRLAGRAPTSVYENRFS
jgi:hypothetical protein